MTSLSALYQPALAASPEAPTSRGLVILLHGWGANAEDLLSLSPALGLDGLQFACPNAPLPHPYSPTGRMWYDLESQNWDGLPEARSQLNDWIDNCIETSKLPPEQVVLVGFSQGGAMTMEVGLERRLGGLVVLSGYLHPELAVRKLNRPVSPMLVLHGQQDGVVPFQAALQTQAALQSWKANVQFRALPTMGHEISAEAIEMVRDFIQSVLP